VGSVDKIDAAHVRAARRLVSHAGKAKTMFETSVASIRTWPGGARTPAELADTRAAKETRRAEAKPPRTHIVPQKPRPPSMHAALQNSRPLSTRTVLQKPRLRRTRAVPQEGRASLWR